MRFLGSWWPQYTPGVGDYAGANTQGFQERSGVQEW